MEDDSHMLCRWSAGIAVDHGFGQGHPEKQNHSNAKDKESRAHRLLILHLLLYWSARIPWELYSPSKTHGFKLCGRECDGRTMLDHRGDGWFSHFVFLND
jgi:hypothetical protein